MSQRCGKLIKRRAPDFGVEPLESRILFSADTALVATLALPTLDAANESTHFAVAATTPDVIAATQADEPVRETSSVNRIVADELVIVDANVPDIHLLLDTFVKQGEQAPDVVVLNASGGKDALNQLTNILASYKNLTTLHLVSHGSDSALTLGGESVSTLDLLGQSGQVGMWVEAFSDNADILLYGCDVAATLDGQNFVDTLARLTDADVAASTDLTGHKLLGGNWDLEYRRGSIEGDVVFDDDVQNSWVGTMAPGLSPVAAEILVNGSATGNQSTTSLGGGNVAMDANGNYAITWQDTRSGNLDSYLKIYNADGTVRVSEFLVHSSSSSDQDSPTVAMSDSGTIVVTWRDNRAGSYDTYVRMYDIDGTALSAETQVSTLSGDQGEQSADIAANGSFVVVFKNESDSDIYMQRYDANGVAQGVNTRVNTTTFESQRNPDVATADDGSYVVVWMSYGQESIPDSIGIYGQRYSSTGIVQGPEFQINQTIFYNQWYGNVDSDAAGNFVVTWMSTDQDGDGQGIYARIYDAGGLARTNEFLVNTTTLGDQGSPNVHMDTSGEFIVTWHDADGLDGSGFGVFAQLFDSAGNAIGGETQINATTLGDQERATVAFSGNDAVLVWSGNGSGDSQGVFARRYSVAPADIASDLAAHFEFEENGGATASDSSGNGNDGSWLNAPTWDSDSAAGSYSMNFGLDSGANAFVEVPDDPTLDINGDFSVAFWYNTTTIPGSDTQIIGKYGLGAGFLIYATSTGNLQFLVDGTSSIANTGGSSGLISDGNWHHVVATREGDTFRVYLDGNQFATSASSVGLVPSADPLLIGGSGSSDFEGKLDEVRLYTRGLEAGEVAELYRHTGNTSVETFTVTNTNDSGAGSLRQAVLDANASTDTLDTIEFNLPGSGTQIITLSTGLDITDGVIIDATTQAGWVAGSFLPVVIDGNDATFDPFDFTSTSDGSEVRGLVIRDFDSDVIDISNDADNIKIAGNWIGQFNSDGSDAGLAEANIYSGVRIFGDNVTVGGTTLADRNVISGSEFSVLALADATNLVVSGNYLGTTIDGSTILGSTDYGVYFQSNAGSSMIGGATAAHGNVIAGAVQNAIFFNDETNDNITVQNNAIGVSADRTRQLGNSGSGINVSGGGDNHQILDNLIAGSEYAGIELDGASTDNIIQGNIIGTDTNGVQNWGSGENGILIENNADNNTIGGIGTGEGNIIAFSGQNAPQYGSGISIQDTSAGNSVRGNSIYSNTGIGIDLSSASDDGATLNDAGDSDSGGNNLQNWAVLTAATISDDKTFSLKLDTTSLAAGTYTIEFYASVNRDGGRVEGQRYLGTLTGISNGFSSLNSFLPGITLDVGDYVTLITTDANGNSSEFSSYVVATDGDAGQSGPIDLIAHTSSEGGLSINDDGGNDTYLIADDGDAIFGGRTSLSVEVQFATADNTGDTTLYSYAVTDQANESLIDIRSDGSAAIYIAGSLITSTAIDYATLRDGTQHSIGVTWDGSNGHWAIYVDGIETDSTAIRGGSSLLANGGTIGVGGTLVFGQEQDSIEGSFNANQSFSGTLFDARVFSTVRSAAQMAASYRTTLPQDEPGMVAHWAFDELSTDEVVKDAVGGISLSVKHTTQSGFTTSEPSLSYSVDENAIDDTVVGSITAIDPEREANIATLLASDPDLVYSPETGKFYKVFANNVNYSVAQANAIAEKLNGVDGQLLTIRSATEQAIAEQIAAAVGGELWLGASDQMVEGEWRWMVGSTETDQFWNGDQNGYNFRSEYTNWFAGRPDSGAGDEDVLVIRATDGQWDDSIATLSRAYLVEWISDDVLDQTQSVTYSIHSQTVDGAFEVVSDNGELRVADGSLLDADTQLDHIITVRSTDVDGNVYDEAFTVSLNDLSEVDNAPTNISNGIELNLDGGNDAYLIAADGGAILGGLSQITVEMSFAMSSVSYTPLISYAATSGNDFLFELIGDGTAKLHINYSRVSLSGIDYNSLADGKKHTVSVSWDNSNGTYAIYVDGELTDSGSDLQTGQLISGSSGSGVLLFGQDQDIIGGGFSQGQVFQGTLFDARIWSDVRSASEIAYNHQHKLDLTPAQAISADLIANWQMDGFNGSNEIVDIVSEGAINNRLRIGHADNPAPVNIGTWTNQAGGITAAGNTLTYVDDAQSTGWNSSINSANVSTLGFTDDYTISFTLDNTTNFAWNAGLSTSESSVDYSDVEYGIFIDYVFGGQVRIHHNGTTVGQYDIDYTAGGQFGFVVNGTTLEYQYDGVSFATDTIIANTDWYIDTSFYTRTADATYDDQDDYSLSNFQIASNTFKNSTPVSYLSIPENASENSSVGFVMPGDPDLKQDIVTDGKFTKAPDPGPLLQYNEGQILGDWTVNSGAVTHIGNFWEASPSGGQSVHLVSGGIHGGITQSLSVEAGRQYQVVFAYAGNHAGSDLVKEFRVSVDGNSVDFQHAERDNWSTSDIQWEHGSFVFTADDSSATLAFESLLASGNAAIIGDVQVIELPHAISAILRADPSLNYDAATDKFYRFVDSAITFGAAIDAASNSRLNGVAGEILRIGSAYENRLIREYVLDSSGSVWLGINDLSVDGTWREYDGINPDGGIVVESGDVTAPGVYIPAGSALGVGVSTNNAYLESSGAWFDTNESSLLSYVVQWNAKDVLSGYTFTLNDSADGRFDIDETSGEIVVADGSLLNYETATSHNIVVQSTDEAGNSYSETKTIRVDDLPEEVVVDTTADYSSSDANYGDTSSITALIANKGADGLISLREAIDASNNQAGKDSISFSIAGAGSQLITLLSELPDITDSVIIDGTTQMGWVEQSFIPIVIDADDAAFNGLTFTSSAGGSEVRGLIMRDFGLHAIEILANASDITVAGNWLGHFNSDGTLDENQQTAGAGVYVYGDNNTIGGATAADRNVIVDFNYQASIFLEGVAASNNVISGNYVGTTIDGNTTAATQFSGFGVYLSEGASNNMIGGASTQHRNVFGGLWEGVRIDDSSTTGNTVYNNNFGLGADNLSTLWIEVAAIHIEDALNNTIGGVDLGNTIVSSVNLGDGIYVRGADGTVIQGNYIGTDPGGTLNAGFREGIDLNFVNGVTIGGISAGEGNVIANSKNSGISVDGSSTSGVAIRGNSIYGSDVLGIDLNDDSIWQANDFNDVDTGPNTLQNWAVLTSAAIADDATFNFSLDTTALAAGVYTVDFYASAERNSGQVEGQRYLGTITGVANGNSSFSGSLSGVSLASGEYVTLITTYAGGNSSEFSNYAVVTDSDLAGASPSNLQTTTTSGGGLNINHDGGNDIYLLADEGGSILGGLTELTFETHFSSINTSGNVALMSYQGLLEDDEVSITVQDNGAINFKIGQGSVVSTTSMNYWNALIDGQEHTLSTTWNDSGDVSIYIDGEFKESIAGVGAGSSIAAQGTLVFGQDQDSIEGGFETHQALSGTLHDIRIFNDMRTAEEIAASYRSDLRFDESGLIANWRFEQFSTDGVLTESVSGNNLFVKHTAESGFAASEASLSYVVNENAISGTVVGSMAAIDAEREARIALLLATDPDLRYSAETDKFYRLVSADINWVMANSAALSTSLNFVGGQLVTIRSAHENNLVADYFSELGDQIWLGASDSTLEGEFRWQLAGVDDDLFWKGNENGNTINSSYYQWHNLVNPNNTPADGDPNGEDYLAMWLSTGGWNDVHEAYTASYIVEWDADRVLDVNQALTYVIQSQTAPGAFEVDSNTGQLRVLNGSLLNYDDDPTHILGIRATDTNGNIIDKDFTISVVNLAEIDNPPTDLSGGIELNADGGNDAYLEAADGGAILGGLESVTVEAVFQVSETNPDNILFSYSAAGVNSQFHAEIKDYGDMFVRLNGIAGSFNNYTYSDLLLDGEKHHFALSWDGTHGDIAIYIDGQLMESKTGFFAGETIAGSAGNGSLILGQDRSTTSDSFNVDEGFHGTYYDFRIWDEIRSEEEIALNYQHKLDLTPVQAEAIGLVANWKMDGFDGSGEVIDGINGNNLSVGHATGPGYIASEPDQYLHVSTHARDGTVIGYIQADESDISNDLVRDGRFNEASDPGSFQNYTAGQLIGDWTVSHGDVDLIGTFISAPENSRYSVQLTGTGFGGIEQTLSTVAGSEYQVVFALTGDWSADQDSQGVRVSAAGQSTDIFVSYDSEWSVNNPLWQYRSMTFVADSTSTVLDFTSLTGDDWDGPLVGDIRVLEIPAAIGNILNNEPTLSYDAATGKFYRLFDVAYDYAGSQASASSTLINGIGGQLVNIRSAYENELVGEIARDFSTVRIGGSDSATEGNWRRVENGTDTDTFHFNGSALAGQYSNFQPGEPDDSGGVEDYLSLLPGTGEWRDVDGSQILQSVVEWDASEVLSNYTYSLTDDASGRFSIESNSGKLMLVDSAQISHESATSHDITVETTDAAGNSYSESVSIRVDDGINPVHTVPGSQSINEGSLLSFIAGTSTEVSVSDSLPFEDTRLRVSLSVNDGVLQLSQITGLTIMEGSDGSDSFVIDGLESDLNAAFNGMTFIPNKNFNGNVTLRVATALAADLDGYYTFEGGSVNDQSGGVVHNGAINGDAAIVIDSDRGDVLSLDGSRDFVQITGLLGEPANVTLAAWVNVTGVDTLGSVVISMGLAPTLYLEADGRLTGYYSSGVADYVATTTDSILGTGWRHVAVSVNQDNQKLSLYVDGVLRKTITTVGAIQYINSANTFIGRAGDGLNGYDFTGQIDNAQIYSRALSSNEIAALAGDVFEATSTVAITVQQKNQAPYFSSLPSAEPSKIEDVSGVASVSSGDFDNDGDNDLLSISNMGELRWYENIGSGDFSTGQLIATANDFTSVVAHDLDGDGDIDIVATTNAPGYSADSVYVLTNNLAGSGIVTFTTHSFEGSVSGESDGGRDLAIGDLDGDGRADIAAIFHRTINDSQVVVFEQDSVGAWTKSFSDTVSNAHGIELVDLDGDSDLDIVVGDHQLREINWYENDGDATAGYTKQLAYTDTGQILDITVGDFDADGDSDIAYITSHTTNRVVLLTNDGASSPHFSAEVVDTSAVGASLHHVVSADTNGDGTPDLIVADENQHSINVYENDGSAQFRLNLVDTISRGPVWVDIADINGNGHADIIFAAKDENMIGAHLNQGNGNYIRGTVSEDVTLSGLGVQISDEDAGGAVIEVAIKVSHGTIFLPTSGVTILSGANNSDTIVFEGSVANINAALGSFDYTPAVDFFGLGEIEISVDDRGNTGVGGARSVSESLYIEVESQPDAPSDAHYTTWIGGYDFLANTHTNDNQRVSSVAALSDGGFVVVWESTAQDGDLQGIYLQRYNSAGNAVGPETLVNTTTTDAQAAAKVTALVTGGFVVVWESELQDTDGRGVYARTYDIDGMPSSGEIRVHSYESSHQDRPMVTSLNGGGFVVVWESSGQDGSGKGVYFQRFNDSGVPLGIETQANTTSVGDQAFATAAAVDDGGFIIVWSDYSTGDAEIVAQRFDANGALVDGEILANTYSVGTQNDAEVVVLSNGSFVIIWQSSDQDGDDNGIFAQRFDASGMTLGGEFRINSETAGAQQDHRAVALDDGGFLVVWESTVGEDGSDTDNYAQQLDAAGNKINGEFRLNTTAVSLQSNPVVTQISDGRIVSFWDSYSQDGSQSGVVGRVFTPALNENAPVGTVAAVVSQIVDPDSVDTYNYSLIDDAGGAFEIQSNGAITVRDPTLIDFENSTTMIVTVRITDPINGFVDERVTVHLNNISEPLQTVPAVQTIIEDTTLTFDHGTATEVSISDSLAGNNAHMQVDLSVNDGWLNLSDLTGISFIAGADGSAAMTFNGTESDINAALDGMTFTPDAHFNGGVTVSMTTAASAELIAAYEFESDIADQSVGTAYNGTATDGAAIIVNGERGNVLNLGGTDDEVLLSPIIPIDNQISASAWINVSVDTGSFQNIVSLSNDVALIVKDDGVIRGQYRSSSGSTWNTTDASENVVGTGWRHVAYVVDTTTDVQQIYIDGHLVSETNFTEPLYQRRVGDYVFGRNSFDNDDQYNGLLDDVRIYSSALPAEYIAMLSTDKTESTDSMEIVVDAVNDSPTATNLNSMENYTEDTPLNLAGIVIDDVDSTTVTVNLVLSDVDAGSLNTATSNAVTSTFTDGVWRASGVIVDVNTLLANLIFTPSSDYSGDFTLATRVDDVASAPITGSKLFTAVAVNDNPINTETLPANISVIEDVPGYVDLSSMDLRDVDANSGFLTVTLVTSTGGHLSATEGAGITLGGDPEARTFSGTLIDLNTYFNTASNITYLHSLADTNGESADTIQVLVNDNGNTGSGGGTDQMLGTVNVNITAVNDAPVIVSNGGDTTAILLVNENQLNVTTVTAVDVDSGDSQSYSLTGGPDQAAFTISAETGVLEFESAPDREIQDSYTVEVTVTDNGGLTDVLELVVNIDGLNEAPVITSNGGGANANVSVEENQDFVTTVSASDEDIGASLRYSVLDGVDSSAFQINSANGSLRFVSIPDYESKSSYAVTLSASDGQLTDIQTLNVAIVDVNERPMIISTTFTEFEGVVGELGVIEGADPDDGDSLTFSISEYSDGLSDKNIAVSDSGLLTANNLPAGSHVISVQLTDAAGLASSAIVSVNIKSRAPVEPVLAGAETEYPTELTPGIGIVGEFSGIDLSDTDDSLIGSVELPGEDEDAGQVADSLSNTGKEPDEGSTESDSNKEDSLPPLYVDFSAPNGVADIFFLSEPQTFREVPELVSAITVNQILTSFDNYTNLMGESIDGDLNIVYDLANMSLLAGLEALDFQIPPPSEFSRAVNQAIKEVELNEQQKTRNQYYAKVSITVVGGSVAIGSLLWLVRSGALVAAAMISPQLWRPLDVVPILMSGNDKEGTRLFGEK